MIAGVERIDGVAPDGRAHRRRIGERFGAQGRAQRRHAGRIDHEIVAVERGPDQRHARTGALREHAARRVGDHPVTVVFETGLEKHRAPQGNARAGLDRIDVDFIQDGHGDIVWRQAPVIGYDQL